MGHPFLFYLARRFVVRTTMYSWDMPVVHIVHSWDMPVVNIMYSWNMPVVHIMHSWDMPLVHIMYSWGHACCAVTPPFL